MPRCLSWARSSSPAAPTSRAPVTATTCRGEGNVTEVAPRSTARTRSRSAARRSGRPSSTSPTCAARSSWSTCGGPAAARAARRCRCWSTQRRELPADETEFVGINIRDLGPENAAAFERDRGVDYPSIYDPGSDDARRVRPLPAGIDAVHRDPRPGGPGRGPDQWRRPLGDHARDPGRGACWTRTPMGEWFEGQAAAGSLALAVPVAVDRRAGLLLLPVRDPAAAGLPRPTRPGSPAPTSPTSRTVAAMRRGAGCCSARCSSSSASRWSSC